MSGEPYEFFELPWMGCIPRQAGVLILAEGLIRWLDPILIVDATSLRSAFREHERRAREEFEATCLFVRAESNATQRRAMWADLVAAYAPPMKA